MLPTITVDIGTTSIKLCLFDDVGGVVVSTKHPTPTTRDAWGEVYQVEALLQQIADFVRGLDDAARRSVRRIAIAGVGESGGLVRPDGSLASPMILWHDHRGADWLEDFDVFSRDRVYAITGLPVNPNYGISKVAWAVDNAGSGAADAQWLNVAEFVAAELTGERWSEFSLASRTMALDLAARTWSAEMCDFFDLDVSRFPDLRTASEGTTLSPVRAAELRLDTSVMVHVAGHDHMVGAVGADLEHNELLNSTGTTEGLLFLTDAPTLGPAAGRAKLANGISCTGSDYTLFASIPTGGSAFATLQGLLGRSASELADSISGIHQEYVAGDVALDRLPVILPQFRGSPPPTKNARTRGAIAGLQTDTTANELILGCFLGMALQFSDVLDLFPVTASRVKVIGPAGGNPLWQQLKADLLGTPLTASRFPEVVSRGAQALASDQRLSWQDSDPEDVDVDTARREALAQWRATIQPQWDYLKGLPA
ncbi:MULTISPECIES: FGGY family carbohydrate kinase [unclassified Curtobacterium]|uniref:FGGY-family carbohydrate kinase n=1 Tax=unclassified Curtobacterium TaxID=257496 RepID=UPI0010CF4CDA|nr:MULTISPECIES: FGGY family carbohydrate kinase [unclassified Curtobacterium]NQW92372.1 hypothetical protein [Curtobacterium sp. VKM Ac-2861]TCL78972.1 sugar (pentulose or hexulose) kinase [Curtobacterium sp. PhB128]TCL97556.1 sugar (pentulose or hexulose) kinase [Curtobacterium sp. PhB138]